MRKVRIISKEKPAEFAYKIENALMVLGGFGFGWVWFQRKAKLKIVSALILWDLWRK